MAKANKTGFYHAPHAEPKKFSVLKENADKTVDIGLDDGTLVVGKCPVAAEPKWGYFTFGELPKVAGAVETTTDATKTVTET